MVIGIGLALLMRPTRIHRILLIITVLFIIALTTGITVGLFGKIEAPKLFLNFNTGAPWFFLLYLHS